MATEWSVTRLVGFEPDPAFGVSAPPGMNKIIVQNSGEEVPNSLNPDGSLTGSGRKGKMRSAFILNCSDLHHNAPNADDALLGFSIPCPIGFQNPPEELSPVTDANFIRNAPLDMSVYIPIVNVTPLVDVAGTDNWARDAKPYIVYNQDASLSTRSPASIPRQVSGGVVIPNFLVFQFGTIPLTGGDGAKPGSFMIEIDWSHTIAR